MNDAKLLMVERGSEGAVAVSPAKDPVSLEGEVSIADGTCADHISETEYVVENGILKGDRPAQSAFVLYQG